MPAGACVAGVFSGVRRKQSYADPDAGLHHNGCDAGLPLSFSLPHLGGWREIGSRRHDDRVSVLREE